MAYCYCSACHSDNLFTRLSVFLSETFCDLDFALSHYFEYLKCLITRTKEPKKFNVQTATKFTFFENLSNMFICYIIGAGVILTLIFFFDPGGKIHLWLIDALLNAILLLCLKEFLFFCLKPVCVLEFTGFSSLFEYQKWRMTRTKEPRKNDLQTTTNVPPPELSGRGVIANFFFYVIFCVVVGCLALIPLYSYLT